MYIINDTGNTSISIGDAIKATTSVTGTDDVFTFPNEHTDCCILDGDDMIKIATQNNDSVMVIFVTIMESVSESDKYDVMFITDKNGIRYCNTLNKVEPMYEVKRDGSFIITILDGVSRSFFEFSTKNTAIEMVNPYHYRINNGEEIVNVIISAFSVC